MNNLRNTHFFAFLTCTILIGVYACGNADKSTEAVIPEPKVEKLAALEQTKEEYKERALSDSNMVSMDTTELAETTITLDTNRIANESKPGPTANKIKENKTALNKQKTKVSKKQKSVVKKPAIVASKKEEAVKLAKKVEPIGELAFKRNFFNYDTITKGDQVEHQFEFTNIGETPVIIKSATATCGCTEPSYPFMPIAPGEKGYIGVKYDSSTKEGKQNAIITVIANTDPSVFKLYLDGVVDVPELDEGDKESDN